MFGEILLGKRYRKSFLNTMYDLLVFSKKTRFVVLLRLMEVVSQVREGR